MHSLHVVFRQIDLHTRNMYTCATNVILYALRDRRYAYHKARVTFCITAFIVNIFYTSKLLTE